MTSNGLNRYFGFITFGESHGKAIGVVVDDVKSGVEFPYEEIQQELNRRKPKKNNISTTRSEEDHLVVLSGVFKGKTTGMPICMLVYNTDAKSADYENIKDIFRPGHADYSFYKKFKIFDYRGGGRASGRETIARIAASGLVKDILKDIRIESYPIKIGKINAENLDFKNKNDLLWPDSNNYPTLMKYLAEIRKEGNSVGGIVEMIIKNVPIGLGDPVFEKLDANLSKAILSIGAVKGIEFGKGFYLADLHGDKSNDQISSDGFLSNNMGGILGGISTGQDIIFRFVIKATPSISIEQKTITKKGKDIKVSIKGRHDLCIVPRIIPVAEAMVKLVLADALSHQRLIENREANISELRETIDKIDEELLIVIYRRLKITQNIIAGKKKKNIDAEDLGREKKIISNLEQKAKIWGINPNIVKDIWKQLFLLSKNNS